MKIYHKTKLYNRTTGKPELFHTFKEYRCDYSGVALEPDCSDSPYCQYLLCHGDHDQCYGAGGLEFEFGEKYNIDMHAFLSQAYCFAEDTEEAMLLDILDMYNKERGLADYFTIETALRTSRVLAATKLLEDGVIEPWQLVGDEW